MTNLLNKRQYAEPSICTLCKFIEREVVIEHGKATVSEFCAFGHVGFLRVQREDQCTDYCPQDDGV